MLNDLFVSLGISAWKPIVGALLLPPVPLLLLVLVGARLILARRGLGWSVVLLAVSLLWLAACPGTEHFLREQALRAPPALTPARVAELKAAAGARKDTVIVVLGAGMLPFAREYDAPTLKPLSIERLRYGMWLSRETGLPVAFSGGVGWGEDPESPTEAAIAARIARQEFGRPLTWLEDRSRDTRQNARLSVAMLRAAGIRHVVLVTHGFHMPRALRAFREAAPAGMTVEAAPNAVPRGDRLPWHQLWLPSSTASGNVRNIVHELVGLAAGA